MSDEVLSELNQTLRKQGRAAVAAQAAAEESLESLKRLEARLASPSTPDVEDRVRSLLPYVDAVDRVSAEARRLESSRAGVLARTLGRAQDVEARALARAVGLLVAQLDGVLGAWGVRLDRATGVPFDGARHRVVESRAGPGSSLRVVEVVRAGCSVGGRQVREADVIVEGGNHG